MGMKCELLRCYINGWFSVLMEPGVVTAVVTGQFN